MPGLAKKPQGDDKQDRKEDAAPSDPFAPPYVEELFVAEDTVKEDEQDAGEGFVVLVRPDRAAIPDHAFFRWFPPGD